MKLIPLFLSCIFLFTASCTHFKTKVQTVDADEIQKIVPIEPDHTRQPAADELAWWAATEKQLAGAVCRQKLPVTTQEIINYYKRLPIDFELGGRTTISGITLHDEHPRLILALAKLLHPKKEGDKVEGTPQNFQTAFKVNPSCQKAICAAQKIFGTNVGPQMLFLMDVFDVNTSPYSFINADVFRPDEIADVIRTFELIFPEQNPLESNQKLVKFSRGFTRIGYSGRVLANAAIELFDGWSESQSLVRQYTLYHEFAHRYSDNHFSDYDRSVSWMALSDWKETTDGKFESQKKEMMKGHPFVSEYGKDNPFEDFAESVTAFRLNPAHLQRTSITKYNFIKLLVFDGREFVNSASCKRDPLTVKYQKQIDTGASLSSEQKAGVKSLCRQTYYQTVLGHIPTSFFASCVDYEATLVWQKEHITKDIELVPQALYDRKIRVSKLKFNELRKELVQELAPEVTDWMLNAIKNRTYRMSPNLTNAEYCSIWEELANVVYPNIERDGNYRWGSVFANRDYLPSKGAARGICLDLVKGYTPPPAKSSNKSIMDWIDELRGRALHPVREKDVLKERGITRETLLKYVLDRTNY